MLIAPKRNIFRVSASSDSDNGNKVSAAVMASLGYTCQNSGSGLVAYGPDENAGTVNAEDGNGNVFSYMRYIGPIDIPLALAISFCRNGFAAPSAQIAPEGTTEDEIAEMWKAGTIAGEKDVPYSAIPSLQGVALPYVVAGASALPDEAWVADQND